MSSPDILQQHLDTPILTPVETINKLQLHITDLETQIRFYEKNELEHQEKIKLYQASLSTTIRNEEELKKALTNAELRNQELKETNVKLNADLSGKIDLLLNERKAFSEKMDNINGKVPFIVEHYQISMMAYFAKKFKKLEIYLNTEDNTVKTIVPIEPL